MKPSSDTSSSALNRRAHSNDDAQAAVIYLFVVGMVAILAVYIWMSPVMDGFSSYHHNATTTYGIPVSQDRQDAIFVTQVVWQDFPIIIFVLMIIASVVAALLWRTSNV